MLFNASAVEDYIEYTVDVPEAGTYHLTARVMKYNNNGTYQCSVDANSYSSTEDMALVQERWEKTEHYREMLEMPVGTVCFSRLTPANVFTMCPMYLSIHISLSASEGPDKEGFERQARMQVENMMNEMRAFAENLNAEVRFGYHNGTPMYDGEDDWIWTYLQGEQTENIYGLYFERYVFDSYRDIFW